MTDCSDTLSVFIVDDDGPVRDSTRIFLELNGMKVDSFPSVKEFMLSYRPKNRACLLLDQYLHGSTGLAFIRSSEYRLLNIPIILMSGNGSKTLRDEAMEAGATAYLEKPFNGRDLLNHIYNAVGAKSRVCA